MALTAEASYSTPLPPAPYIFLKFGISTEFQAQANFALEKATLKNPLLGASADLTMTLTPSMGIGAGLDRMAAVEAGIEGPIEASLNLPFKSMKESVEASISAKLYLQLTLLAYTHKSVSYTHLFRENRIQLCSLFFQGI